MEWLPAALRVFGTAVKAVADVLEGKDVSTEELVRKIDNELVTIASWRKQAELDRLNQPARWAEELDSAVDGS
jgi:transposase-like protein